MRRRQQCTRQRERDAKQTKSCASALAEFAADVLATTRVRGVAKMLKRGRRVAKQKDITRTKQGLLQLKAQTRASRMYVARHKHHQSKGVQLTLGQQLDIAHSPLHNSFDAMAQVYLSHRTTIARTLLVQGEFEITAQLKLTEKLEGWLGKFHRYVLYGANRFPQTRLDLLVSHLRSLVYLHFTTKLKQQKTCPRQNKYLF